MRRHATARAHRPARAIVVSTVRRRRDLAVLCLWALLGAVPTFGSGIAVARAIDDGFLAGDPVRGVAWLGALAATVPLGALGSRRTYLGVARLVEPMRDALVGAVVEGALARSADPGTARDTGAVARLTQHVESVRDTVAGLALLLAGFAAAVAAALGGLVALAPVVVPLVSVPLAVSVAGFAATLPALVRRQQRLLVADERLADLATGAVEGRRDVTACGGEDEVIAVLDERIGDQARAAERLARSTALRSLVVAVGGKVPVVLVLASSGWLLGRGLSPGGLAGTLTYLVGALDPAVTSVLGTIGGPLAQVLVTIRRLDDAGPPGTPAGARPREAVPRDGGLVLQQVTFGYRRAAEPVVDALDLVVPAGDHLAVVGPSGAGKSTLAALMVGVLRPDHGTVLHGGAPAHAVSPGCRVLIPQQAYVFRGTLGENLRYLQPGASDRDLDGAVTAIGMARLVERIGGYGAAVDPAALSAGERQLVALARAWLSPATLVVLDEATCHLDARAEAVAEEAFAGRGGTLVVVAHRISSARRARRILVMDGAGTALGTHDELVRSSALYRDLAGHWSAPGLRPVHRPELDVADVLEVVD